MIDPYEVIKLNAQWQQDARSGNQIAERLAQEICGGCQNALIALGKNLERLSYPCPTVLQPCFENLEARIAIVENKIQISIPPTLKMVWKVIGGISLIDLKSYRHADYWDEKQIWGPDSYCDALYLEDCSNDWTRFICADFDDWVDSYSDDEKLENPFILSLSPDGYHKDNISGGSAYGIYPGNSWLAAWENFTWAGLQQPEAAQTGKLDLLSYLRIVVLECAGFPALYGHPKFEPIRRELLQGIQIF